MAYNKYFLPSPGFWVMSPSILPPQFKNVPQSEIAFHWHGDPQCTLQPQQLSCVEQYFSHSSREFSASAISPEEGINSFRGLFVLREQYLPFSERTKPGKTGKILCLCRWFSYVIVNDYYARENSKTYPMLCLMPRVLLFLFLLRFRHMWYINRWWASDVKIHVFITVLIECILLK